MSCVSRLNNNCARVPQGYAKTNTDKYHALTTAIVYVASNTLRRGVGGHAAYTDSATVLHLLGKWFRSVGLAAAAGGGDSTAAQVASIRALAGLSLASGSLGTVLALLDVLMAHEGPLPEALAREVRSYVLAIDDKFDDVGAKCNSEVVASGASSNPDRTDEGE